MKLQWVDSHCHFDFDVFNDDREQHWQWLQQLGMAALIIPGISRQQGQSIAQLCNAKPWFYAQGLHPYFIAEHQPQDLQWLETQLQQDSAIIAVGEIGLDKVLATTTAIEQQQQYYFLEQLKLAKQYGKPLILHVRGQHDQMASLIKQQQFTQGGIVHAFSGSVQQAKVWLNLGFKLGIGGAMTHAHATKLRTTVASLPADAWLLETDSPDMASAFWRSTRHSPAAIPCLAACLAVLHGITLAEVAAIQRQQIISLWPQLATTLNH